MPVGGGAEEEGGGGEGEGEGTAGERETAGRLGTVHGFTVLLITRKVWSSQNTILHLSLHGLLQMIMTVLSVPISLICSEGEGYSWV